MTGFDRLRPQMTAFDAFSAMGLEPYLQDFIETNGASSDNPYHNLGHALRVVESALAAAQWDAPVNGFTNEDFRAVCVAALFHDWRHPGGVGQNDDQNVHRASQKLLSLPEIPDVPWDRQKASQAILDTVYPLVDGAELSYMGLILRDADVWHVAFMTNSEFFSQILVGLAKETDTPLAQWCEQSMDFFRGVDAFTDWAKRVRSHEAGRLMQHSEDMAALLGVEW